jgi:hypothetical protein
MFRLTTGTLEPGDQVTLVYGDTSRGSRGFLMADFSSDRMPLPLYLAFAPDEPFITLPIAPIRVTGTEIASVHGFAPSVVRPGEPFTCPCAARTDTSIDPGTVTRAWKSAMALRCWRRCRRAARPSHWYRISC